MQTFQRTPSLDVHGMTLKGASHAKNHDHFAIATLKKSVRLHQTNLDHDDRSQVQGEEQGHLFLVADGIAAGPAPARASGRAVDSVVQYFLNELPWSELYTGDPEDVTALLEDALANAQDEVLRSATPEQEGLGTTMTLAFVFWPHLYVAHVGDSRCYLSRGGRLTRLTTDHTLAQVRRILRGSLTARGPRLLWNAIGGRDTELEPEVKHVELQPGDTLALVTDGVTKGAGGRRLDRALRRVLESELPAEELCGRIVGRSAEDDRTAIVVRFAPQARAAAAIRNPDPRELEARRALDGRVPKKRRYGRRAKDRSRPLDRRRLFSLRSCG